MDKTASFLEIETAMKQAKKRRMYERYRPCIYITRNRNRENRPNH